MMTNKIEY